MDSKPVSDKPTPVNPRREGLIVFVGCFVILIVNYLFFTYLLRIQSSSGWIYSIIILSTLCGYGEYKMQTRELERLAVMNKVSRVDSV
jgi:uncharacterized membrane protein